MLKSFFFCLILNHSFFISAVSLSIKPSFLGGKLSIENQGYACTNTIIETLTHHTSGLRGWWHITIKSENEVSLNQLLESNWMQIAMTSSFFGFRISHLDLSNCHLRFENSMSLLPGSKELKLTLSKHLLFDKEFQNNLSKLKRNNRLLAYRGTRMHRIFEQYQNKDFSWQTKHIN